MKPLDQFSTFIGLMDDIARKRVGKNFKAWYGYLPYYAIWDLLFNNDATDSPAIKNMRKYRDKCMDTSKIEQARTTQLKRELDVSL